jgi:hypothetical protein
LEIGQSIAFDRAKARTTILRLTSEEIDMNRAMLKMFRCRPSQSMGSLARRAIAAAWIAVFTTCLAGAAAGAPPSPQAGPEKAPTVRERILAMPPHTMVQVKLHNKKIRGRVSVVTRKGFVIQFAAGDKTDNEKISFDDVESIQALEGKGTAVSAHIVVDGADVDVRIEH